MPYGYKIIKNPKTTKRIPFSGLRKPKNEQDIIPNPAIDYQPPTTICLRKGSERFDPIYLRFSRKEFL